MYSLKKIQKISIKRTIQSKITVLEQLKVQSLLNVHFEYFVCHFHRNGCFLGSLGSGNTVDHLALLQYDA